MTRPRRKPRVTYVEVDSDVDMDDEDRAVEQNKLERDKQPKVKYDTLRAPSAPATQVPAPSLVVARPVQLASPEPPRVAPLVPAPIVPQRVPPRQPPLPPKPAGLSLDEFMSLPNEIMFEICSYIEGRDLIKLSWICKRVFKLMTSQQMAHVWREVRKEYELVPFPDFTDLRFVLLACGTNCQSCGARGRYSWGHHVDWIRCQRLCDPCINVRKSDLAMNALEEESETGVAALQRAKALSAAKKESDIACWRRVYERRKEAQAFSSECTQRRWEPIKEQLCKAGATEDEAKFYAETVCAEEERGKWLRSVMDPSDENLDQDQIVRTPLVDFATDGEAWRRVVEHARQQRQAAVARDKVTRRNKLWDSYLHWQRREFESREFVEFRPTMDQYLQFDGVRQAWDFDGTGSAPGHVPASVSTTIGNIHHQVKIWSCKLILIYAEGRTLESMSDSDVPKDWRQRNKILESAFGLVACDESGMTRPFMYYNMLERGDKYHLLTLPQLLTHTCHRGLAPLTWELFLQEVGWYYSPAYVEFVRELLGLAGIDPAKASRTGLQYLGGRFTCVEKTTGRQKSSGSLAKMLCEFRSRERGQYRYRYKAPAPRPPPTLPAASASTTQQASRSGGGANAQAPGYVSDDEWHPGEKARSKKPSKRAKQQRKEVRSVDPSLSLDTFVDLPFDILFEIFSYLGGLDLIYVAKTSKVLYKWILSNDLKQLWSKVRKEEDLVGLEGLSDVQVVLLLCGKNCQSCGERDDKHGPDLTRLERRCEKCIRANSVALPYGGFSRPPQALVDLLGGRVHPRLCKVVSSLSMWSRNLTPISFGDHERLFSTKDLWKANKKLYKLQEEDELDDIAHSSIQGFKRGTRSRPSQRDDFEEQARKTKVEAFIESKKRKFRARVRRVAKLKAAREDKQKEREDVSERQWAEWSEALVLSGWTNLEISRYKDEVWSVEKKGRQPKFALRSPTSTPLQDEQAWRYLREKVQRLQLRRAKEARRQFVGIVILHAVSELVEERPDGPLSNIVPSTIEFVRLPSVRQLWDTNDSEATEVTPAALEPLRAAILEDWSLLQQRMRAEMIKHILTLTHGRSPNDEDGAALNDQHGDEVFNMATATFTTDDLRNGGSHHRLATFPEWCREERPFFHYSLAKINEDVSHAYDADTVGMCRRVLQAAGLVEDESTIDDLRALQHRFAFVNADGKRSGLWLSVADLLSLGTRDRYKEELIYDPVLLYKKPPARS
ncbi:hypothetical protein ACM66B_004150 [Microbotryomycetes sp. NB124-2]